MTAKAKAKPKARGHTTSVTHGNTRTTTTRHGHVTTTTRSVKHGSHVTSVTTVKAGGKVISQTTRKYVVQKAPAHHQAKAKAKGKKRGAPGDCTSGGFWVTGGNDLLATCVPVALANSCLIATGYRIPDWQVMAMAGKRSIADVLSGLGLRYRLADGLEDGVILGVAGGHTVTALEGAAVSYGCQADLSGYVIEEAWEVDWR